MSGGLAEVVNCAKMKEYYIFIVLFCICWTTLKAEIVFDVANTSHQFAGFGAQVWPGDSRVERLSENLNLKYYRIAPCGFADGNYPPPTDSTQAVMDTYVSSRLSAGAGANTTESLKIAEALGIKVIFVMFGGPPAWLGTDRLLKSVNFDDYARLWASVVYYFESRGMQIDYVELFNEPEGNWNIKVPEANYNTFVKLARTELDSRGLTDVGIAGPGLAYLLHGTSWINALDSTAKNALAAWSTHAWDEGWGHTDALPSFLDQRWQDYFGAAVNSADPDHLKPIIVTEYASGVQTYNGVDYNDSEYGETSQFAQRCYENSLTLVNNGATVLCYWEAANQSWQDGGYAFLRKDSTLRPTYYVMSTLMPYVPSDAMVLTKTWNDSVISAAGFVGSGKLVLAFANSSASTVNRTISVSGVTSLSITSVLAFQSGDVINKISDFSYDFNAGNMPISLPPESTLTIVADIQCGAVEIGDLNGDCKVTFADFTKVASDWFEDNRVPCPNNIVNDFESYTNDAALVSEWVVHTSGAAATETLVNENGSKCMRFCYSVGSPGWAQTKYNLPGAVWMGSGVSWDNYTDISFKYKIADQGSNLTQFTIWNSGGEKIGGADFGNGTVTNGWVALTFNLQTIKVSGENYDNVCLIGFTAKNTYSSGPTGDFYIDDIVLSNSLTVCSDTIAGDINGDCVVNFEDIKVLGQNWLQCTLINQSICW